MNGGRPNAVSGTITGLAMNKHHQDTSGGVTSSSRLPSTDDAGHRWGITRMVHNIAGFFKGVPNVVLPASSKGFPGAPVTEEDMLKQ